MRAKPRILALFGARVLFGAERASIETLAALQDQGCEVLCLVRHEAWNDHVPAALAARGLASRKVPFVDGWLKGWRLRIVLRNPIAMVIGNWRMLRIAREFQPTHVYAFNHLHVLSCVPALAWMPAPLIYHAHDSPTRHRWFWRALWSFVVRRTSRFVAVSRFIAKELQLTNVRPGQIEVIYCAPPKRVMSQTRGLISEGCRNVVFIGQISEHKGPHLLVEAFRKIAGAYPDSRLFIAGRISEWRGDEWAVRLRDQVAGDPLLRDQVVFLGFVEDLPNLLKDCIVLVVPSIWEDPMPLVVTESKEAGLPAVVFPSGGLPELIENGVDGHVCCDKTVAALEHGLRFYLQDPSLARQHGLAARASLARFGISDFGRKWLSVFEATKGHAESPRKDQIASSPASDKGI